MNSLFIILHFETRLMYIISVLYLWTNIFNSTIWVNWNSFAICITITIASWITREMCYYGSFKPRYDPYVLRLRLFGRYKVNLNGFENIGIINGFVSVIYGVLKYTLTNNDKLMLKYYNINAQMSRNYLRGKGGFSAFNLILLLSQNIHYSSISSKWNFAISQLGIFKQSPEEFWNEQIFGFHYNNYLLSFVQEDYGVTHPYNRAFTSAVILFSTLVFLIPIYFAFYIIQSN